jgi:hypothetical protein
MGRGFEAEEKKWPWTRFFVTAALLCKLFPFFPRFVIVTYYLRVFNKCDNGSRRVFVRPVKIKMVD